MASGLILLDTNALLWWVSNPSQLSSRASRAIKASENVAFSTISGWEVATLIRKGRVSLGTSLTSWFEAVRAVSQEVDVDLEIATFAGTLSNEFPGDPADRLIYATAFIFNADLVTKDRAIRGFAAQDRSVKAIW